MHGTAGATVRPKTGKRLRSDLGLDDDTAAGLIPEHPGDLTLHLASASRRRFPITHLPALLLTVLAVALLPAPGAGATSDHVQGSPCTRTSAHHSHGTIAGRCVKHATHRSRRSHTHKHSPAKKPAHKPSASKSAGQVPASCEDGSPPVRASGSFSCRDGSEPACQDGSEPARSSSGAALLCSAPAGNAEGEEACEQEAEGECPGGTWACEEGSEACRVAPGEESSEG
jgi:hypothetical protein